MQTILYKLGIGHTNISCIYVGKQTERQKNIMFSGKDHHEDDEHAETEKFGMLVTSALPF